MADRYWVGGTGTWNASNTANWSASSGGASGASVPTSADDVFFNSSSNATAYTVTLSTGVVCKSITVAGPASGNVTIAGNTTWSVYGNFTLSATGITWSNTAQINFLATTTGNTIITNGVVLSVNNLVLSGAGGGWVLGGAISVNSINTTGAGASFDTSNYNMTGAQLGGASTSSTTLGSSTVTVNFTTPINFTASATLSAGTSQINCTGASAAFVGNGLTFNNVSFTIAGAPVSISGANTFNNLTFTAPSSAGISTVTLSANQTITGTLTASGATEIRRLFIISDTLGTARTITAATYSPSHVDFRDITGAGAASPFVATTGGGDCGGNSGITFPSAKTVYWNLTGTQNWSATAWATTSGGTPALANFPLAQDTAIFNNTGAATTVTYNATWNAGTIDFSARTSAVTFTVSNRITSYGDFILGSGVTYSGTGGVTFSGNSKTMTLTTAGKTTLLNTVLNAYNGTLNLGDALSISVGSITFYCLTITQGTFDTQNYSLTLYNTSGNGGRTFLASGSLPRTLNFGSSTVTLTGNTNNGLIDLSGTNITVNAGTSSLVLNNASNSTINMGTGLTFNNVTTNVASTTPTGSSMVCNTFTYSVNVGAYSFVTATNLVWNASGAVVFTGTATNYTFNPTAAGSSITFAAGTKGNITVNNTVAGYFTLSLSGNLTLSGALTTTATDATMRTLIQSNTAGTTRTLTAASASLADVDFYWITGAGAASWTGTRLGNVGNNSGITTDTPKTVYWNLAGAQNWNATGWATSSGGSPAVNNYPLPQDTAVFDDTGSVTGNITMLTTLYYPTIDMSARTSAMTLVTAVANLCGGLELGTGTTISGTSAFTFIGDNPAPIQCSGKTLANALTYSKVSGTVTQQDDFTSSTTVTLNNGTYNAANYNFTATSFNSSNSNTRAITMGSGTWTLTGTGTPWTLTTTTNLTFSGASSTIVYSDATNAATKIFAGGGLTYGTLRFGGGAATGQIFQLTGSNTFNTLSHTKTVAFTIQFTAATTTTVTTWSISGTAGNLVTIGSVTAASHTLTKVGGIVNADYLSISRSTATPATTWYAGANSTNGGNNSGWIFTVPPLATPGSFLIMFYP